MSASNNAAAIAAANNPKRNLRTGDNSAVRSLSANLKYPYKRTISAPAGNYYWVGVRLLLLLYTSTMNSIIFLLLTSTNIWLLIITTLGMGLSARSTGGLFPVPTSSSGTGTPCYRQTSAPNLKGRNVRDTLSKQVQISPNGCDCTKKVSVFYFCRYFLGVKRHIFLLLSALHLKLTIGQQRWGDVRRLRARGRQRSRPICWSGWSRQRNNSPSRLPLHAVPVSAGTSHYTRLGNHWMVSNLRWNT